MHRICFALLTLAPDGRWLVAQDVFNSDLAAGAELAKACPLEIAGDAQ